MELELLTTNVFTRTRAAFEDKKIRFIIEQGGSRAGKTHGICQLLILYCLTNKNKVVSIVRKSFPSLRGSVMRDFFAILDSLNIYNKLNHNKGENVYRFNTGSMVEFFSVDDQQKVRGRKRDVLFVNEANELDFDEFNQLNMRTSEKLIFDFNPSENFHWLYDLITRDNSILIHSTYQDNPFLPIDQVKEIENLINIDESYYKIYALGERGLAKTTIITNWKYGYTENCDEILYGLDFGYNHYTALVECRFVGNAVYVKELLYKAQLTSTDLIKEMDNLDIIKTKEIVCDVARPEMMEDLRRARYNVKGAIKNVVEGIDSIKRSELYITKESINLVKELNSYKWKTNGDIILNEPVKVFDDLIDAMRYAIHYNKLNHNKGKYVIL